MRVAKFDFVKTSVFDIGRAAVRDDKFLTVLGVDQRVTSLKRRFDGVASSCFDDKLVAPFWNA